MGQGLYRCVGWGVLNPPPIDWDDEGELYATDLYSVFQVAYEAKPEYLMIPFGVDDEFLQASWNLPPLPPGLPHVEPRTAVTVPRCEWWPDVGKAGVWVSWRIVKTWEALRLIWKAREIDLPEGEPLLVCDWD